MLLAEYPALLQPETLAAMTEASEKAYQEGKNKVGESLQTAAEKVSAFARQSATKILWAIKARRGLALLQPELLNEAITNAHHQPEIVAFLQAFVSLLAVADGDFSEVDRLTDQLIPQLKQENRREEAATINLLYLDTRVSLIESYRQFPVAEQDEMKELGIKACRLAIRIAENLADQPCEAHYSVRLADCFRYSRQPLEAEQFYQRALPIYRDLAAQEPHLFNSKLALTLSCLGVVQIYLERLISAEISIAEAVQLYRNLAGQEPKLFKEKLEIAENNLNAVQILQQESMDEEVENK